MYWWGEIKFDDLNIFKKKKRGGAAEAAVQIAVPTATGIIGVSVGKRVIAILKEKGKVTVAVRLSNQHGVSWKQSKFFFKARSRQ